MLWSRRQAILAAGAALVGAGSTATAFARQKPVKKVLFYTKSAGFEHSVVDRHGFGKSHAEMILMGLGKAHGFEVVASKDGHHFDPDKIGQWDAFVFETTGDLTVPGQDEAIPMTKDGEKAFYDAIRGGKGFIGVHCATDTFGHHRNRGADDPYIELIGAEFAGHGPQQVATQEIIDPAFPGIAAFGSSSFTLNDEWYSMKNVAGDLHVVLSMSTSGMNGKDYARPNFPSTWSRMHGKGRVFYTSMGHREDVWTNPKYQGLLLGALDWVTGQAEASVEPNLDKATPGYADYTKGK